MKEKELFLVSGGVTVKEQGQERIDRVEHRIVEAAHDFLAVDLFQRHFRKKYMSAAVHFQQVRAHKVIR